MSTISKLSSLVLALGLAVLPSAAGAAEFDVTVYNLSNQIFSPPIVVTHTPDFSVFEAGGSPSAELAALAEDADSAGLVALLGTMSEVGDIGMGGNVILPGGSMTVRVEAKGRFRVFTALGMLVTTNDSFYSATQRVFRPATFHGPAYDAGSEANTLDCAHIPGPPCGNKGVRVTEGAEGVIKISEGINHGSLLAYDWRNPVVKVAVERVRE